MSWVPFSQRDMEEITREVEGVAKMCDAYPRLVQALKALVWQYERQNAYEIIDETHPMEQARELLRELGET